MPAQATDALVSPTVLFLTDGRPTPFANEGHARAALRVFFVVGGQPWSVADALAAAVVERALVAIGATRPTWTEANPVEAGGNWGRPCEACGRTIPPTAHRFARYCSAECKKVPKGRRSEAYEVRHRQRAREQRARKRLMRTERRCCEHCGDGFHAIPGSSQRFCRQLCAARHGKRAPF